MGIGEVNGLGGRWFWRGDGLGIKMVWGKDGL